jgi:protein SCO1/2
MRARPAVPGPSIGAAPSMDGAFRLVMAMTLVLVGVIGFSALRGALQPAAGPEASPTPPPVTSYLYPDPRPAPALALVDQDGADFTPERFAGGPTLLFFGYTHCPDICPTTMGIMTQAATQYGSGLRVVFVSVDPERDTVDWLKEYVRYLPTGFSALTGTPTTVRAAAAAWGVRYARVETDVPGEYSMSHTAGVLRAHFPFGTEANAVVATVRYVAGAVGPTPAASPTSPPASATPASPSPSGSPAMALGVEVVSSSVWAGGARPVILRLTGTAGPLADVDASVSVRVTTSDGAAAGPPVRARAVRPPGVDTVSYVAFVDLAAPGWWGLAVTAESGGRSFAGQASVSALDPGATAALGRAAPAVRTPTLDDVSGVALRVTTDPLPELRLSRTSTADALAAGQPFVLVVDSARFKVTPACGKALSMAKFFVNRWPDVPFIHLEPYAYDVVTDTAVLRGSLSAPSLVEAADAWGTGAAPWGVGSMPWVFIVDAGGSVVAKYQGVVGSDDIDVIVALLVAGG